MINELTGHVHRELMNTILQVLSSLNCATLYCYMYAGCLPASVTTTDP